MNQDEFRLFLSEGSSYFSEDGWLAIPAKHPGKPQPKRPDLPYITVLEMDTQHMGIPYRYDRRVDGADDEMDAGWTANVLSLLSVQFHGTDEPTGYDAMDMALAMSLWVRGDEAGRWVPPAPYIVQAGP